MKLPAEINYIDLFSGFGGFHKGIEEAGIKIKWCGFSEIWKPAIKVYKKHFSQAEYLGDVRAVGFTEGGGLPDKIHLITFGFPCQDLSIAGRREGIGGARSGLFFEAVRVIDELRPDFFIFENVKGLLSNNGGKDFATILRAIADIGYNGQWDTVNTNWFLPQDRERVYFIGFSWRKTRHANISYPRK